MEQGAIVEFVDAADEHRLGVVTARLGKKKLVVLTLDGVERRPLRRDVTVTLGHAHAPVDDHDALRAELGALRASAAETSSALDLEPAWQAALDAHATIDALDAARSLFGDAPSPAQILATLDALRDDLAFFKTRHTGWLPNSPEEVGVERAERVAARTRASGLDAFLETAATLLKLDAEPERFTIARRLVDEDPGFGANLALLQEYASLGDDFERAEEAIALLDALGARPGVRLHGRGSLRAFHVLVDLGIWSRHENLWLRRYRPNTSFPNELTAHAAALAQIPWEPDAARRDLTDVTCFTVDDPWTHDLDDAISCSPRIEGGWVLCIHIADPGERVTDSSPLDLEARERGTSIYLPTGTVPMLPTALSEGVMSLQQGQVRPAVTTRVLIDRDLNVVDVEVFTSTVRVDHRLTYDEVEAILEGRQESPLATTLRDLSYLASEFFHQRLNAGAVDFDIPEVKLFVSVDQGQDPEVTLSLLDPHSPARTLVAESMILASSHMARFCYRNRIPVIYRSQQPPDGELVDDEIRAYPEGLARTFAMLRRMKSGTITTFPEPHFALGVPMYVQATSPLRRYSDFICQRQVKAFLADRALPYDADEILTLAANAENTAREAARIERETRRYWTLHYLSQRTGAPLTGTVLSWRGSAASIFLHEVGFRARCTLRHELPVGEQVTVTVKHADPRTDLLELEEL